MGEHQEMYEQGERTSFGSLEGDLRGSPKNGMTAGAAGRRSANLQRRCGCCAGRTSRQFRANWA